ncbi:MAG: AAA family ATPase [Thalassovita sp.]
MRLRSLSLERFGHFTDHTYDFGTANSGSDFHIIYGPNEAGKSTTMEAVLRLFYGFPTRESYAFKHTRPNLMVSGVLDIDNGTLPLTRLSKRNGSLLDPSGAALPETALSAHLAGLSEDDYRKLLCLDDETIERGGEEIAQARGDIGRLLFSAAAGVADLSSVLDGVQTQAKTLWKKGASKTRIAELKRTLKQVTAEIRDHDVSASAWRGLKRARTQAEEAEHEARTLRNALHSKVALVAAQSRAIPLLLKIDGHIERLAPFAAYPDHLSFDPEVLVDMMREDIRLTSEVQRLSHEINTLTSELEQLERAPDLLGLGEQLEAMSPLKARYDTAKADVDRRQAQVDLEVRAMRRAAQDLGVAADIDPTELVVSAPQLAAFEAARQTLRDATHVQEAETQGVIELQSRLDQAQQLVEQISASDSDPQTTGVDAILARHDADTLATLMSKAQLALDTAQQEVARTLGRLSFDGAGRDGLPPCATSPIKAQRWADTHADLRRKIDHINGEYADQTANIAAMKARSDQVIAAGQLIADAEAQTLLSTRDTLWHSHKSELNQGSAEQFERAMHSLDGAMRLRVEQARDLGELRQIETALAEAEARAEHLATRLAEASEQKSALEQEVAQAAAQSGIHSEIEPAEWLDWVQRHALASDAVLALEQVKSTYGPDLNRAEALCAELGSYLDLSAPSFETVLSAARALAQDERDAAAARGKARDHLETVASEHKRRAATRDLARDAVKQAQEHWHSLVQATFGASLNADTLRHSLEPLRLLRAHDDKRADGEQRVKAMLADQAKFREEINALAVDHSLSVGASAAETFASLSDKAILAQASEEKATRLSKTREAAQTQLQKHKDRLQAMAQERQVLAQEFPAGATDTSLEALRQITAQAHQVIADRHSLSDLELSLVAELGVTDVQAARDMLAGASLADLEADANALRTDLESAEVALTAATEARVTATQALQEVTGGVEIAALSERKTTLELELEEAALEYLELTLGHRLAEEAIRRYRDSHRSGMMTATERCFRTLTNGAYERLDTQPDGSGEVLMAVDAAGQSKQVADMSKGTRFQLYLALRAAAHEQLVSQGTRLPFFCDDIFETFDEERTSAACKVMEQIGQNGQAIYLTHHRHVVEIALKVCAVPPRIHTIGPK